MSTDRCPHGARWTTCGHEHPPKSSTIDPAQVTDARARIDVWVGMVEDLANKRPWRTPIEVDAVTGEMFDQTPWSCLVVAIDEGSMA